MSTAKNPEAGNLEANSNTTTDEDNVQVTGLSDTVSSPDVDINIDFSDGVVYEEDLPDEFYSDDLAGFPDEPQIDPPDDVDAVYEVQQLEEAEAAEEQAQAAVERVVEGHFPTVDVRDLVDIDVHRWEPIQTLGATAMTSWVARMRATGFSDARLMDVTAVRREVPRILTDIASRFNAAVKAAGSDADFVAPPKMVAPKTIPTEVAVASFIAIYQPVYADGVVVAHYDPDPMSASYGCHVVTATHLQGWVIGMTGHPLTRNETDGYLEGIARTTPKVASEVGGRMIALNNGIFDYQEKVFTPFSRDIVVMSKSSVNWNANAVSPVIDLGQGREEVEGIGPEAGTWEVMHWLRDLADDQRDIFELLCQVIHAVLRPTHKWAKMLVLYSPTGNNGKGTFLSLLRGIVGQENAVTIPLENLGGTHDLEQLLPVGGRVPQLIASDESDATYLDKMATLNALVTQNEVLVNPKNRSTTTLRWRGLIVQCMNTLPKVKAVGGPTERRWLIVPFVKNFGAGNDKIPEIPEIAEDFISRTEVLEFLVRFALVDLPEFGRFTVPEASVELSHEQQLDSNAALAFWEEFSEQFRWFHLPSQWLYDLYKKWTVSVNPSGSALSMRKFLDQLEPVAAADGWVTGRFSGTSLCEREPLTLQYGLMFDWGSPEAHSDNGRAKVPEAVKQARFRGFVWKGLSSASQPSDADHRDR
ncbi:phage/plasmid primase, P4 family [Corynebacterium glyciniphilum]|uniref:phage/plasmid primase, P4 family n=1 Tax=Corynebacterium glyciniphilum TaxID=1404244 RepID=UPI0011AB64C1|nr:phage/plasmid primase, P4 family [Corynebacterium glyciniphilum]